MTDEMSNEEQAPIDSSPQSNGTAVATAPSKKPESPPRKREQLPPYKVLLHNDEVNTFEHVIQSVVQLTTIATQEALLRTIEAHESGVSLLLVTHRERAELYVDQFKSLSVTVSMEPAEE